MNDTSHPLTPSRFSRRHFRVLTMVMAVGGALIVPVATASVASASTCSPAIATTINGTWRLHVGADVNSAATGASVASGAHVTIDAQQFTPNSIPVTVAGFGTSAVMDHVAGGWFSDLGSTATPYQVLAPTCQGAVTPAPPAPAPTPPASIGGVDMQAACNTQYAGQGRPAVVLDSQNAYSWVCHAASGNSGINVDAACSSQYGYGATSGLAAVANPWSWYCRWGVTAQMNNAVAWAVAEKNSPDPTWSDAYRRPWSGYCEGFVHQAEHYTTSFPSATIEYVWQLNHGRIHTDTRPPAGAVVFWDGGTDGHVAVSIGGGQAIGTYGLNGQRLPVRQYPVVGFLSNHYRGWAFPVGS